MPYLTSMPPSPLPSLTMGRAAVMSVITLLMTYGLISMLRLAGGGSRPTSDPAPEIRNMPLAPLSPPIEAGSRVR